MSRAVRLLILGILFSALTACTSGGNGNNLDATDATTTDATTTDVTTTDATTTDVTTTDVTTTDVTTTDTTEDLVITTGALTMTHAGTDVPAGSSYSLPDFNPSQGAVAIYSEQKDRMALNNTGDSTLTLTSIVLADLGDVLPDEFQLCDTSSGVNQCIPYVLPGSLDAGAGTEFFIHFYPLRSDLREASLTVAYNDGTAKTYGATIRGYGRIGSDANPAFFFSSGTELSHKLWGGYTGSADEAPGALEADADGNLYFVHRMALSSDTATITRINADGTVGWSKQYSEFSTRETADDGGYMPPDSMDLEGGYLYVTGRGNNGALTTHVGVIMKLDIATGDAAWIKYWSPNTTRLQYTDARNLMAIDAESSMVFVTGHIADYDSGNQGLGVLAFDAATGNNLWSKLIVPQGVTGTAHRGHSIRSAGNGVLFVAGLDYSAGSLDGPYLAKLSGVDASGTNVVVDWAEAIGGEVTGSNFNSMDLDSNGDVFLSLGITGPSRHITFVKAKSSDGSMVGTTLGGATNSWSTSFVVRAVGTDIYGGARAGISGWDSQKGDALLAKFSAVDMSTTWSALYYTGTGPNEVCAHSVHGIAANGNNLYVMGQVYTGNSNYYRYYGLWYDDPMAPAAYEPTVNNTTSTTVLMDLAASGEVNSTTNGFMHAGALTTYDWQAAGVEWQDATAKNETTNGAATDGDLFISTITQP